MKYNTFLYPMSEPSRPTYSSSNCQIKISAWCLEGSTPPNKNVPFVACPPYDGFKILPNLYAPPSLINMTTMKRQHKNFLLLLVPPDKPVHQAIHYPTANFGPLLRGSITNPMLITVFDTYLTPVSPGAW